MFGFGKSLGDSNELFNYVSSNDFYRAKNFIESKGYNEKELNNIQDCYGNNVLHVSVMNTNQQMVSYFLEKGVSHVKQNKFKQSPWDLAVASKNSELLERFVSFRTMHENVNMIKLTDLSTENDVLKTRNRELKRLNSTLEKMNSDLEKKYSDVNTRYSLRSREITVIQTENAEIKTSNKRLREEVTDLKSENKKLKDENIVLINKNEKLKLSIETLMNNSKR